MPRGWGLPRRSAEGSPIGPNRESGGRRGRARRLLEAREHRRGRLRARGRSRHLQVAHPRPSGRSGCKRRSGLAGQPPLLERQRPEPRRQPQQCHLPPWPPPRRVRASGCVRRRRRPRRLWRVQLAARRRRTRGSPLHQGSAKSASTTRGRPCFRAVLRRRGETDRGMARSAGEALQ